MFLLGVVAGILIAPVIGYLAFTAIMVFTGVYAEGHRRQKRAAEWRVQAVKSTETVGV